MYNLPLPLPCLALCAMVTCGSHGARLWTWRAVHRGMWMGPLLGLGRPPGRHSVLKGNLKIAIGNMLACFSAPIHPPTQSMYCWDLKSQWGQLCQCRPFSNNESSYPSAPDGGLFCRRSRVCVAHRWSLIQTVRLKWSCSHLETLHGASLSRAFLRWH